MLSSGKESFLLILYLRLIPFVPSGLVTFCAAIGNISLLQFGIASSIGKIPALLLEGYSSYQVLEFGWQGKLILTIVAVTLIYLTLRNTIFKKQS
ncbi:MAG: VTT domain-containing protein [Flavisolibacter sp.]